MTITDTEGTRIFGRYGGDDTSPTRSELERARGDLEAGGTVHWAWR